MSVSAPTSPTARSMWRSSRLGILLGAIVVLAAVLGVLLAPAKQASRHLDPDDGSLAGAKALAQLLRARGVTVDRVESVEAAAAKQAQGDRLLLLTADVDLTVAEARRLAALPGDRLIVGDVFGLETLAPGVRTQARPVRDRSREPECDLPAVKAAGSAFVGGQVYRADRGCYPADEGYTLITAPTDTGTATLVGSGEFMTNQRLAEDGNAALAINLAGSKPAVTWLVNPPVQEQTQGELAGEEGRSLGELVPPGIPWAVLMGCVAVLLVAFWRGRRLGPVVTERLPVVVRAAETVEGRGRLYRARRARERAADLLRAGTIDRLTPRLGLGPGAGGQEIVAAIAVRTGRDAQEVGAALYGPPPADDAGLVALAGYLDFIERMVSER
ncbi:DUF4350 domain-containing protein [Nonomuraea sediminis]|uniref:DUF4350 domain-containing protein n=1 Tax=Nonomuraea sediminis TaxID=2835864 RepID=UPI001BDC3E09|nr:DUF4350 domain-containing protein [Nonomuraea sediminis]